jgi:hypothetical protein
MLTGICVSIEFVTLYQQKFIIMKKLIFSGLMVCALSFMASAQTKQPTKKTAPQTSKTTMQTTKSQPQKETQATTSTQQKSTTMAKPKHKKHHRKAKQPSTK